jgi:hypothetical protein
MPPSTGVLDNSSRSLSRRLRGAASNLEELRKGWNRWDLGSGFETHDDIYERLEAISSRVSAIQSDLVKLEALVGGGIGLGVGIEDKVEEALVQDTVTLTCREFFILQTVFSLHASKVYGTDGTEGTATG